MPYQFQSRIRYSEIGENGCLTLPGIQDYYQDCCTFQSEEIGQGMEVLEARQRAWVLSAWQMKNWLLALLGSWARAMEMVPRVWEMGLS